MRHIGSKSRESPPPRRRLLIQSVDCPRRAFFAYIVLQRSSFPDLPVWLAWSSNLLEAKVPNYLQFAEGQIQ
eukprot:1151891-Pelagomonas_calceolata.AAC.1